MITTDLRTELNSRIRGADKDPLLDQALLASAQRGYCAVGLDGEFRSKNLAMVVRAASCLGAAFVAAKPGRVGHIGADSAKAIRHLPVLQADDLMSFLPAGCTPVAVELQPGATSLHEFKHPERAFYFFGPERGGLDVRVREKCDTAVQIFSSDCLNLAASVNVVLYDRLAKSLRVRQGKAK